MENNLYIPDHCGHPRNRYLDFHLQTSQLRYQLVEQGCLGLSTNQYWDIEVTHSCFLVFYNACSISYLSKLTLSYCKIDIYDNIYKLLMHIFLTIYQVINCLCFHTASEGDGMFLDFFILRKTRLSALCEKVGSLAGIGTLP